MFVNAIVRFVGHGDAFLLSPFHLEDKAYAVCALGLHSVRHLWRSDTENARELVSSAASEAGVPVGFALAIARAETGFRNHAISSAGAMGMMQLMPETARSHGVLDPFDPEDNVRGAMRVLAELFQRYRGDGRRIAAAYNAGTGRVPRAGELELPAETRSYVGRVMRGAL